MGGFNFHFKNEHDSKVCKLRSLLNECCLKQLVNQLTHCCVDTLDRVIVHDDSPIIDTLDIIDTAVFCKLSLLMILISTVFFSSI